MKALKLMIAIAMTITASASFAEPACNGQVPVSRLLGDTAHKPTAALKSVVPASKTKAVKGIRD